MIVEFIGCDGAGKTTLGADAVRDRGVCGASVRSSMLDLVLDLYGARPT